MGLAHGGQRKAMVGGVVALLAIAFVCWAVVRLRDEPPSWVEWKSTEITVDGEQAGQKIALDQRRLKLFGDDGSMTAQTPGTWLVQQVAAANIDDDGMQELVLLVWKRGSFGTKHPFWVSDKDDSWSQHVFVLKPVEVAGEFDREWMSSALGKEVSSLDINEKNELVLTDREGNETYWYWDSWGFAKKED